MKLNKYFEKPKDGCLISNKYIDQHKKQILCYLLRRVNVLKKKINFTILLITKSFL